MSHQHNEPLSTIDGNARVSSNEQIQQQDPFSKPATFNSNQGKQQQSLHRKLMDQQKQAHYVSPSDSIMSPMSQKLSSYKQGRFAKTAAPKRLFARTASMNSSSDNTSSGSKDSTTGKLVEQHQDAEMSVA